MRSINWPRVTLTGALSALLIPVSWGLTRFWSGGVFLASLLVPDGPGLIPEGRLETAAISDFALWFAFFWGARGLWIQLREGVRERGAAKRWISPLRDAVTPVNAILCALPLLFYIVLSLVLLFKVKAIAESTWAWATLVSLVACALAICGLFAVAVRFWPASGPRRWDSDEPEFTTLNLH